MKRAMVVVVMGVVALLASARGASAQALTPAAPDVELSLGYQFQRFEGGQNFAKGWYADIAKRVGQSISLVGQVTGSYKSDSITASTSSTSVSMSAHSFMGGVRVSARQDKTTFFAQALFGAVRIGAGVTVPGGSGSASVNDSDTSKAGLVGVGATTALGRNVSLRVGGDYVRVFPDGDGGYILRATAGLVFGFGSR